MPIERQKRQITIPVGSGVIRLTPEMLGEKYDWVAEACRDAQDGFNLKRKNAKGEYRSMLSGGRFSQFAEITCPAIYGDRGSNAEAYWAMETLREYPEISDPTALAGITSAVEYAAYKGDVLAPLAIATYADLHPEGLSDCVAEALRKIKNRNRKPEYLLTYGWPIATHPRLREDYLEGVGITSSRIALMTEKIKGGDAFLLDGSSLTRQDLVNLTSISSKKGLEISLLYVRALGQYVYVIGGNDSTNGGSDSLAVLMNCVPEAVINIHTHPTTGPNIPSLKDRAHFARFSQTRYFVGGQHLSSREWDFYDVGSGLYLSHHATAELLNTLVSASARNQSI